MPRNLFKDELFSDDSDDELELTALSILDESKKKSKGRGSVFGHRYVDRHSLEGHIRLYQDYFSEEPVYSAAKFRRRFRMRRSLFLRIHSAVEAYNSFFVQKRNAAQKLGLSSLQKITAPLRMLAYGVSTDYVDEYLRMGESTTTRSLKKFVKAIVNIYGDEYLRSPNEDDIAELLKIGENRGFPGMLGSLDCMHWKWKNCPASWKGMYSGHVHEPTVILEAVASYDLWIWHAFFGLPGSHNDINVLERSFLFSDLAEGRTPPINYTINGHNYSMGYYLADGIYPPWSTFVKTNPSPQGNKKKHFAAAQESARKDIERAFGVLQARFAIIRGPARFWKMKTLVRIMKACIILHNMILEDERDEENLDYEYDMIEEPLPVSHEFTSEINDFIETHHRIRDKVMHLQLQADLVEHLWQQFSAA